LSSDRRLEPEEIGGFEIGGTVVVYFAEAQDIHRVANLAAAALAPAFTKRAETAAEKVCKMFATWSSFINP
jgi:hypothetical protein